MGFYGLVFFSLLSLYFYHVIKSDSFYDSVYTFLEYGFFTAILWNNIGIKKLRLTIIICSVLFVGAQILTPLIVSDSQNNSIDSIPVGIETILIFIYIIFFFYENFRNNYDQYIYNHHCFWLSIGMLIYLGGTFFFNLLGNYFNESEIDKYWFLTHIADIIKNLFFCVSIIVYSRGHLKGKLFHHSSVPHLDFDMN